MTVMDSRLKVNFTVFLFLNGFSCRLLSGSTTELQLQEFSCKNLGCRHTI